MIRIESRLWVVIAHLSAVIIFGIQMPDDAHIDPGWPGWHTPATTHHRPRCAPAIDAQHHLVIIIQVVLRAAVPPSVSVPPRLLCLRCPPDRLVQTAGQIPARPPPPP